MSQPPCNIFHLHDSLQIDISSTPLTKSYFLLVFFYIVLKKNTPFQNSLIYKHIRYCISRSSPPEVFLGKGVLKICRKFTGEHPCRSVTSIKLFCNFIKITLWHGCSPVNLLHTFRTPSYRTPLECCFRISFHFKV